MNGNKIIITVFALISVALAACGGGSKDQETRNTDVTIPKQETNKLVFPDNFMWGSATSAYQVEGGWDEGGRGRTNWDILTQNMRLAAGQTGNVAIDQYHRFKDDVKLMAAAGLKSYRFSIAWSRIYPTGFPFELDMKTGSPVLDENGNIKMIPPNQEGIAYYNDLINELLKYNIEPVVTLFHWDMPLPLWGAGGFNNRMSIDMYAAYARTVFMAYGDRVTKWLTMNEPFAYTTLIEGIISKVTEMTQNGEAVTTDTMQAVMRETSTDQFLGHQMNLIHNYILAHAKAVEIEKTLESYGLIKDGDIGIAFDMRISKPASDAPEDVAAAKLYDDLMAGWFFYPIVHGYYPPDVLSRLNAEGFHFNISDEQLAKDLDYIHAQSVDYLGVNYYSRPTIGAEKTDKTFPTYVGGTVTGSVFNEAFVHNADETPGSVNGPYDPQGLYDTLMFMHRESHGLPILITENGAGYKVDDVLGTDGKVHDTLRIRYMNGHIRAVWKAIDDGVNVIGYTAWSLFDNFEWFSGYGVRFGMIYIDYDHDLKRIAKDSLNWFKDVIQNNSIPVKQ